MDIFYLVLHLGKLAWYTDGSSGCGGKKCVSRKTWRMSPGMSSNPEIICANFIPKYFEFFRNWIKYKTTLQNLFSPKSIKTDYIMNLPDML